MGGGTGSSKHNSTHATGNTGALRGVPGRADGGRPLESYIQTNAWHTQHSTTLQTHTQVRYAAYQDALMAAAPLLEGKTVLDVGCGVGMLSLMAAEVRGWLVTVNRTLQSPSSVY